MCQYINQKDTSYTKQLVVYTKSGGMVCLTWHIIGLSGMILRVTWPNRQCQSTEGQWLVNQFKS